VTVWLALAVRLKLVGLIVNCGLLEVTLPMESVPPPVFVTVKVACPEPPFSTSPKARLVTDTCALGSVTVSV